MSELHPVPGLPNTYVTEDGDVFSDVTTARWSGKIRKLTPSDNGRGYMRVVRFKKAHCIHRLIAVTFLGAVPPGMEVNHKDGDKLNNRPENLEYVSRSENMKHCFRSGLWRSPTGDRHHMAKLSQEQVDRLRYDYVMLLDGRERMPNGAMQHLQEKYGMTWSGIKNIALWKTWRGQNAIES